MKTATRTVVTVLSIAMLCGAMATALNLHLLQWSGKKEAEQGFRIPRCMQHHWGNHDYMYVVTTLRTRCGERITDTMVSDSYSGLKRYHEYVVHHVDTTVVHPQYDMSYTFYKVSRNGIYQLIE
jgi:hypothetical protein